MAFFELGRLVAELEVEEIEGPALEVVRNGTCPPDRAQASLDRWRAKRARGEDISRNLLARALLDGGHDPPATPKREVVRRSMDDERAWAIKHLPALTTTTVVGALFAERRGREREPTTEEVREHALAKALDYFGEPNLALRASYTAPEQRQMEAEDESFRTRRPDLFGLEVVA